MRTRSIAAAALLATAALTGAVLPTAAQAAAPGGTQAQNQAQNQASNARLTLGQSLGGGSRFSPALKPALTGVYIRIHSLYSVTANQCLDADATAGGNGTKVQVWACNGSTQQEWISWNDYSIESVRFPGMCLDADTNGNGANGTKVQLWACNSTTQQEWFVRANDLAFYNTRYNNNYNTVLDRDATVPGNGARAQLWAKNFQSQQWWQVTGA